MTTPSLLAKIPFMTILEKLEQSVSVPILGEAQNIAVISLLEQYYAVLIARLASSQIYTLLLQDHQPLESEQPAIDSKASGTLFEKIWPKEQQELIINELVATHHIDKDTTTERLMQATPLAYHELKVLAGSQFLPSFLQQQQLAIRPYLPIWAESVLVQNLQATKDHHNLFENQGSLASEGSKIERFNRGSDHRVKEIHSSEIVPKIMPETVNTTTLDIDKTKQATADKSYELEQVEHSIRTDAIHANPSDHNLTDNKFNSTRIKNNRNDLLVRLLLLVATLTALALLWMFVIQPRYMVTSQPVVAEPIVLPQPKPAQPKLIAISLLVAVDNGGNLYTCTATLGDANYQQILKQALVTTFGTQANICQLEVKQGVASGVPNMDHSLWSNLFTILRSAPFARLQLNNEVLILEAPDSASIQRLLTDMRAIAPNMTINTSAAFDPSTTLQTNNPLDNTQLNDNAPLNGVESGSNQLGAQYNNANNSQYQTTNQNPDNATPAIASNLNNYNNGANSRLNNENINDPRFGSGSTGLSESEVEDLANSIIVSEQLNNESRVQ